MRSNSPSSTNDPAAPRRRTHLWRGAALLPCVGLALALGCNDPSFCDALCDDLDACGASISQEACANACQEELAFAREVAGSDCVAARKDYLDCSVSDFCDDFPEPSPCREDAIQGEIDACGEPLGEF